MREIKRKRARQINKRKRQRVKLLKYITTKEEKKPLQKKRSCLKYSSKAKAKAKHASGQYRVG